MTGDFNGDGRPDIAVANGSNVVVLLANASGGFSSAVTYSSGGSDPCAIATGDFNGDGKLDLAVANYNSNTIGVLLGNGDGTFAAATTYASGGSNPDSLAVGDFNGDGKQDIVLTNNWGDNVGVLLGNGNGTFGTVTTYGLSGSFPAGVAVGDFNGDGHPDLAVAVNWGNINVLLNNGNGTFGSAVVYGPNTHNPYAIAVGDFNGDGKLDLAVANSGNGTVSVLLGNGNGTFATDTTYSSGGTTPEGIAVGDFNKDGKLDLVVSNDGSGTVGVLLGNGNGTFAAASTYSTGGNGPCGIAVADFNGDGYGDLAVENQSSGGVAILPRVFVPASVTLASPDGYSFDVQENGDGAGQILQGTANAFDGMNRLRVGGTDYAPTASSASLADNGQSVLLPAQTMAGLTVTREVSVPVSGSLDFARTIDSFQNTTAHSITTTVTILGNLGSDAATVVFATSDGTGVVSANDQWIGVDDGVDGGGTPAVIAYIRGPGGPQAGGGGFDRRQPELDLQSHGCGRPDRQPGDVHDPEHEPGHRDRRGQCPGRQWGIGPSGGTVVDLVSIGIACQFPVPRPFGHPAFRRQRQRKTAHRHGGGRRFQAPIPNPAPRALIACRSIPTTRTTPPFRSTPTGTCVPRRC